MRFRPQPRGMIQQPELEEMLESQEPFTGLVVSIGINDTDSSMWHSQRPDAVGGELHCRPVARERYLPAAPPTTNSSWCARASKARSRSAG